MLAKAAFATRPSPRPEIPRAARAPARSKTEFRISWPISIRGWRYGCFGRSRPGKRAVAVGAMLQNPLFLGQIRLCFPGHGRISMSANIHFSTLLGVTAMSTATVQRKTELTTGDLEANPSGSASSPVCLGPSGLTSCTAGQRPGQLRLLTCGKAIAGPR